MIIIIFFFLSEKLDILKVIKDDYLIEDASMAAERMLNFLKNKRDDFFQKIHLIKDEIDEFMSVE